MTECYRELLIKIYPLIKPVEEFLTDWPEKRMDRLVDKSFINPELLKYFDDRNIKIRENFIIWHWNISYNVDDATKKQIQTILPHTDGDWFSNDLIVRKRLCGINWNFTEDSYVEFYSSEGATPKFIYRSEHDFSTRWENATEIIDEWHGAGPVLFNPQVPHNVKSFDDKRLSITLRFYETYESLRDKLNA